MSTNIITDLVIAKLAAEGFDGWFKINSTSRTADLFRIARYNWKGAIKIFKDSPDGVMTARQLFELERFALKALAPSGRVPELVYEGIAQPEDKSKTQRADGFFVVKPYYETFLDRVITSSPPLKLLEHAAQEVDISEQLFRRGWRDLDGSFMNDAFDADGRLIRVDLDGAKPSSSLINRKVHAKYQTEDEVKEIIRWLDIYDEVFNERREVSSLAVRISRLLLSNEEDRWRELLAVTSLRGNDEAPASAPPKPAYASTKDSILKLAGKARDQAGRLVGKQGAGPDSTDGAQPDQEKETGKSVEEKALEAWASAWQKVSVDGVGWLNGALTRSEARLLALLTFHILKQKDHGFTIKDFYNSLMTLLLGALEQRKRVAKGGAEGGETVFSNQEREQLFKLASEHLYEVRTFLQPLVHASETKADPTPPQPQAQEYYAQKVVCRGGAWPSNKKGADWECQDMVWCVEDGPAPVFLLADGASKAGGLKAIQAVSKVANAWQRKDHYNTKVDASNDLCALVKRIHDEAKKLRSKATKDIETTLVAGMVYNALPAPVLFLITYGNSGFIVTYEADGKQLEGIDTSMNYDKYPDAIGARSHANFNPQNELLTIPLGTPGIWRVRAFSDGVGDAQAAWKLLSGDRRPIEELVTEAAEWSSKYGHIGIDDWSVAGFDITVENRPTIDSHWREEVAAAKKRPPFPWEGLEQVAVQHLLLSGKANKFWMQALSTDPQLAEVSQYPLIIRIFGEQVRTPASQGTASVAGARAKPPRASSSGEIKREQDPQGWSQILREFLIPIALTLLVVSVIGYLFYLVIFSGGQVNDRQDQTNSAVRPSPVPQSALNFSNQTQKDIYMTLKSRGTFVLNDIPPGNAVEGERMFTFLADLARVLRDTNMRVVIKVHTDSTGTVSKNKSAAEQRGRNIKSWLETQGKVPVDRVNFEGVGELQPLVAPNTTDQAKRNRRLEVLLIG